MLPVCMPVNRHISCDYVVVECEIEEDVSATSDVGIFCVVHVLKIAFIV